MTILNNQIIKNAREELGLTQDAMANLFHTSKRTLARMEAGKAP